MVDIIVDVEYATGHHRYYRIGDHPEAVAASWHISDDGRSLVFGRGVPRVHVPLTAVVAWTLTDAPAGPPAGVGMWCGTPAPHRAPWAAHADDVEPPRCTEPRTHVAFGAPHRIREMPHMPTWPAE